MSSLLFRRLQGRREPPEKPGTHEEDAGEKTGRLLRFAVSKGLTFRPFLPHFPHAFPAFPAVPFGLAGVGTVGLTPLGQKRLSADRTGPQLRGDAFRCQRRLKLRVKRQDSLTEITAVRPCPALVQHIAGTVKRKAQAAFPVIVGAHPRDKRTDFLLLVTGQLPGVHLRLRATMARRAGLHDQRPELLPALFFLSF